MGRLWSKWDLPTTFRPIIGRIWHKIEIWNFKNRDFCCFWTIFGLFDIQWSRLKMTKIQIQKKFATVLQTFSNFFWELYRPLGVPKKSFVSHYHNDQILWHFEHKSKCSLFKKVEFCLGVKSHPSQADCKCGEIKFVCHTVQKCDLLHRNAYKL